MQHIKTILLLVSELKGHVHLFFSPFKRLLASDYLKCDIPLYSFAKSALLSKALLPD